MTKALTKEELEKIIQYKKLQTVGHITDEVYYQLFEDHNKPPIDTNDIISNLIGETHKDVVDKNTKVKIGSKEITTVTNGNRQICFGDFLKEIQNSKVKPNRMWYRIDIPGGYGLTDKLVSRWIKLGKIHKFVPDSFEVVKIKREYPDKTDDFIAVIINNLLELDANKFYLGVAFLRYIRESPSSVIGGIHLMDDIGLDPYVAFVFNNAFTVHGEGHSPINVSKMYGREPSLNKTVNLSWIIGLRRFIFEAPNDKNTFTDIGSFSCSNHIFKCSPKILSTITNRDVKEVSVYDTITSEFIKILECEPGSKEEDKAIKAFINKKEKGLSKCRTK